MIPSSSTPSPRFTAASILKAWLISGDFPDRLVDPHQTNRAFVRELVYGCVKQRRLLEWVATQYSRSKPDPDTLPHILPGIYQLLFMEMHDYAAVHETVETAKSMISARKIGYLNSVLRRVSEQKESILARIPSLPLGLRTSHPDILIRRWTRKFNKDTDRLCEWNNTRADVTIRPVLHRTSVAALLEQFQSAGIAAEPHPHLPEEFIRLLHVSDLPALPGFEEGLFAIQDPSTATSVSLLDLKEGLTILDACAAPGGKTMAIADWIHDQGKVIAMDLHQDRLAILRTNLQRLRFQSVTLAQGDATKKSDLKKVAPPDGFDRILLDVPCSNTGVLRRRPDARWRFTDHRLKTLTATQTTILTAASSVLKSGGILVYSTCSIEPEENEELITHWLQSHRSFERIQESQILPFKTQTDGAYAAAIRQEPNPSRD